MGAKFAYLMDNAHAIAEQRMAALAALYDAPTREALARTGIARGWHCLEIGGGGGSVARWLADQVGEEGSVLCTDLDTRYLEASARSNLRVVRHDIVSDALPEKEFDLIHLRLVLNFIIERTAVLDRLVAALKPGGWLVVEDFDSATLRADPAINPAETQLTGTLAVRSLMSANGSTDAFWGRRLFGELRQRGLTKVSADGRASMWASDNDGAALQRVNFDQLAPQLIEQRLITREQLAADRARLDTEDYAQPSPIMWTVAGRKTSAADLG
jgi:SAM-dependent methyltransferase